MCFSAALLVDLLIKLIVFCAIIGVIRIVIPWAIGQLGANFAPIARIFDIIMFTVVAIFVIYFAYDLLKCALH